MGGFLFKRDCVMQVFRFLLAGGSGVVVDYATYRLLLLAMVSVNPAKAIGFIAGTLFVYFAHRWFTFRVTHKSRSQFARFLFLYAFNLGLNVTLNAGCLWIIGVQFTTLAFLFATAVTTATSFFGQKFWVFRGAVHE